MVVGSAPQLGFSITSPFKAVAKAGAAVGKGVYSVARDPNVQRAALQTAQVYAPQKYAAAQKAISPHVANIQKIRAGLRPGQAAMADDDDGGIPDPGAPAPINNNSKVLTFAAIGGGILLIILLTK